jgi:N-acetyl sugar amidotransferase
MRSGLRYDAKNYNRPSTVKFCTRCVNSNQRPRLEFDENGVCSACLFSDLKKHQFDWAAREKELFDLCDMHRKNDGSYDCLVPSSGGKDSAFVAHMLKYKYKMNPLTITWSPHLYTEIGFQNFQNHIHVGNLSNVLLTPPGETHRKLTKLAFEHLGDPFLPFIYGQNNMPLQMAELYKIPLIFYGENSEVEYGGAMGDAYSPISNWEQKIPNIEMSGMPPETFLKHGITKEELHPYMAPPLEKLKKLGLEVHFFGYYHNWIPQENYYYCVENTGFKPNPIRSEGTYSKYASLDDKLDGFHYYLMYIKFGFGRATSDAAHEVRDGHITREEAIALVKKFDGEFPAKYYDVFKNYCDINDLEFNDVIDSWRAKHIWKRLPDGEWKIRNNVCETGYDDLE